MKFWARRGAVAWLLWPVSLLFGIAVLLRRSLYGLRIFSSRHPGIPVIVVGNISVGGTGKTPLVIWIAEILAKNGWMPGVISRGYKGKSAAPRAVTLASDPAEVGDEPVLISRRAGCPVWVGADRLQVAAALRSAAPNVNVLVLDDGCSTTACAVTSRSPWWPREVSAIAFCCRPVRCVSRFGA
jgi:tetraacyldisaccharide 4'-kinase